MLGIDVLVEPCEDIAGLELTGDLIFQRVTELERLAGIDPALSFGALQARQIGIGDGVADDNSPASERSQSKMYWSGLTKPVSRRPPGRRTRNRLAPYRMEVGNEQVGTRVKDEIEGPVAEGG